MANIVAQGDPATSVMYVEKGAVRLSVLSHAGKRGREGTSVIQSDWDQRADVVGYGWSSWSAVKALPPPEHPEGLAMPRDHGLRLDDDEGGSPLRPDATEPYPEEPICRRQLRSLHRAIHNAQLVTERQDLELQDSAAAERPYERRENGGKYAWE